ncbi:YcnI family protein [Phenylobacterium sp.]|uniref:YcnI family copper-binding membrane protein n=1 Tax=Phenylobacterium sp. TaxID=1871053 RepID=UPI00391D8A5A
MDLLRTLTLGAALCVVAPASAHVAVQPTEAKAGSYQVLRFGVGHGCDGAATTAVRIEIPEGVSAARPQPKPGWTLDIARAGERVAAITWTGALPADQFEEFVMLVKLPAAGGALAFPAVQSCGAAVLRWTEPVPADGPRPAHPAPILTLTPASAPPEGGHDHH